MALIRLARNRFPLRLFSLARLAFVAAVLGLFAVSLPACGGAGPSSVATTIPAREGLAPALPAAPSIGMAPSEADVVVPIGPDDAFRGDRRAYVTMVVFTDLQCPFCARHDKVIARLERDFSPSELRVVTKHLPLPFHPHSRRAAEMAQGVFAVGGNEAFMRFTTTAFVNQTVMDVAMLERWASDAGVDGGKIARRVDAREYAKKVDADLEVAKRLGVNGTPSAFVNGTRVDGAVPYEELKQVVDTELAGAKLKEASGTPRDALYAAITAAQYAAAKSDEAEEEESTDTKTAWRVPIGKSPVTGPRDAPVTIVVFSDFECPFCKKADATLEDLRASYGDKVRVVWKDEPLAFHKRAMPAAQFARFVRGAKGDEAFWKVKSKLFASSPALGDDDFRRIAREVGVDGDKALVAVAKSSGQEAIDEDLDLAEELGATGTPQFFVNGVRIMGAQPREVFRKIIDAELVKANDRVAAGTPKTEVYEAVMKTAKSNAMAVRRIVLEVPKGAATRGSAKPKVTLQVFSDFQCPFCARLVPSLAELEKTFGTDLRIVWRDRPLTMHKDAALAAEAARLVLQSKGNAAFWKMHDRLFAEQKGDGLERDALVRYAVELGVDKPQFEAALDAHAAKALVDADGAAADAAEIKGTPSILVGDRLIVGAQPLSTLERAVRRALREVGAKKRK